MEIRLVKLKDSDTAEYKNHIEDGKEVYGDLIALPRIGECFFVGHNYRTSTVKEILGINTFRTNNSIYKITEP